MWNSFISGIEMMQGLAEQVIPTITIKEERGHKDGTHCSVDESGKPVLLWDSLMYEYFENELTMIDTLPYEEGSDDKMITEMRYNYLGLLLNHLSEKNKKDPFLHDALRRKAYSFNYTYFKYMNDKLPEVSEWKVQLYLQTGVFKLLLMYHEIAHCLFSLNSIEKEKWEKIVIDNLKILHEHNDETYFFESADKKRRNETLNLLKKIRRRDNDSLEVLNELAADAFAVSKAYATTHLNIYAIDKETLSDNIMVAYLRYLDISSQYGFIVNYWSELYGMCITKKLKNEELDDALFDKSVMNAVRCELFGVISIINIIQADVETWNYLPTKGISLNDPRIQNVMDIFANNAKFLSECTNMAVNPMLFNSIVKEANDLRRKNEPRFEYPVIPEGAIVKTWLSIQYYNSCGLEKKNHGNYREALKDFRLACALIEEYLGHNHRLTARAFNNVCVCYLGLAKDTSPYEREHNSIAFMENVELASYHSSYALDILYNVKATEDIQAGPIFQNAAEILTLLRRDEEALDFYLKARAIKEKVYKGYIETHAITDFSLACVYYRLNRFLDAKKSCARALEYYKHYKEEDDPTRKEVEGFYEQIQYMMSPSDGASLNIFSRLSNGECVNLDQYNDWSDLFT